MNGRIQIILYNSGLSNIVFVFQQKFGIKTAGLEDKCTAMQMLVVYARDLKEGFAEYAETVRYEWPE